METLLTSMSARVLRQIAGMGEAFAAHRARGRLIPSVSARVGRQMAGLGTPWGICPNEHFDVSFNGYGLLGVYIAESRSKGVVLGFANFL